MKRKFVKAISLLMIAVISITQTGATELQDAEEAAPETPLETPIETVVEVSEETTELGLALADIPETMSAEQTVEAEHVARLREEELEPNTAVFRNSDGTNTLYIFSEEIWYENEDGEKVDYSTELEAAPETAEAAYRATGGGGELLLPGTVGENTPIEYSEGLLDIAMYPTTDKILFPQSQQVSNVEAQLKPSARPAVQAVENDGIRTSGADELEDPALSSAVDIAVDPDMEIPISGEALKPGEFTGNMAPGALSEQAEQDAGPVPEPEDDNASDANAWPESIGFTPVSEKLIVSISDAEEAQAIAMANAQASLATGKAVNTASLVSANDTAVPDKQSVEYFRASRDASIVTTPLLHGVKNEIVLASYGGNNTYSFVVELNGLEPAESTGDSIPLLDENGALKAYINIEELRDAEGKVSLQNRIDIAPYAEDGKYLVMVTLDEAFMTDPQTVYPLSATSPASVYGDDINDADVNSGSPSKNYASSSTLWVGYINGAVYRSYLQFIIGEYSDDIAPNSISNAYMILYEKSGNTSTFSMQSRIPSNIWNYTSLTWNNQPGMYTAFNGISPPGSVTLTQTSTMYQVPMTNFVQGCVRNYLDDSVTQTVHEKRGLS